MNGKQSQRAGDDSLLIQVGTINVVTGCAGVLSEKARQEMAWTTAVGAVESNGLDEALETGDAESAGTQLAALGQSASAATKQVVQTVPFRIEADERVVLPRSATLISLFSEEESGLNVRIEDDLLEQINRDLAGLSSIEDLTSAQEAWLANLIIERKHRKIEVEIRAEALRVFLNSRRLWIHAFLTEIPMLSVFSSFLESFIRRGWFGSLQQYADNPDYQVVDCYNSSFSFRMPIKTTDIIKATGSDMLPPVRHLFALIDFDSDVRSDAVVWLCYAIAHKTIVLKRNIIADNNNNDEALDLWSYYCGPA